jgi:hypothetical protein
MPDRVYTGYHFAIAQELYETEVNISYATERCAPLAEAIVTQIDVAAASLFDVSTTACAGTAFAPGALHLVTCTYTNSRTTVESFVSWMRTNPLPEAFGACAPMTVAFSKEATDAVQVGRFSPPAAPSPPSPPPPPPAIYAARPSPPPPPPSPPPSPPLPPPPPSPPPPLGPPPRPPPSPPRPPPSPPSPPPPPGDIIANLDVCHPTCFRWARDDQEDDEISKAETQTSSCAGFFANLCAFDSLRFEALLAAQLAHPSPPPPPKLAVGSAPGQAVHINHVGIHGAGGVEKEYGVPGSILTGSKNPGQTVRAIDTTHPWLAFDLEEQHDELYAVEIRWAELEPPSPPPPPPSPASPPPSPFPDSPPPSPFPPMPPPSSPPIEYSCDITQYGRRDTVHYKDDDSCRIDNVYLSNNGVCNDGGPGSVDFVCFPGTDATDCGYPAIKRCDPTPGSSTASCECNDATKRSPSGTLSTNLWHLYVAYYNEHGCTMGDPACRRRLQEAGTREASAEEAEVDALDEADSSDGRDLERDYARARRLAYADANVDRNLGHVEVWVSRTVRARHTPCPVPCPPLFTPARRAVCILWDARRHHRDDQRAAPNGVLQAHRGRGEQQARPRARALGLSPPLQRRPEHQVAPRHH